MERGNALPLGHDPSATADGHANLPPGPPNRPAVVGRVRRLARILYNQQAMSLMHIAALVFLTYNSAFAVYRARSDPWTLAFVVTAYSTLMLLFWCLRAFEIAPPEKKERFKLAIWLLAMSLNAMFLYPRRIHDAVRFCRGDMGDRRCHHRCRLLCVLRVGRFCEEHLIIMSVSYQMSSSSSCSYYSSSFSVFPHVFPMFADRHLCGHSICL